MWSNISFSTLGKIIRLRAYIEHTCDQCDFNCQCAAYLKKQKRCHTSKSSNSHKAPCFQLLSIQYYLENVKLFSNHLDPGPGQICVQCNKWFCLHKCDQCDFNCKSAVYLKKAKTMSHIQKLLVVNCSATKTTWKLTAFTGIKITDSHLSTPAFIAMVESFHLCSAVRRKGSASKPKFDDGILGKAWHQWYARRG